MGSPPPADPTDYEWPPAHQGGLLVLIPLTMNGPLPTKGVY